MKLTDLNGSFQLNNGVEMPYFGLGVFKSADGNEVINAVKYALKANYRHIDTAAIYDNEKGVGQGIKESGIDRKNIFVTSKVWNSDQGYENTLKAFDESLKKLQTDYLDLYLVHWPVKGKFQDTWRALEFLYNEGKVRAIGVSNFIIEQLEELQTTAQIIPMVNQVEFHPYLQQKELFQYCKTNGIQYQAWSPLMQGRIFEIEIINKLATKYNKTEVQIVLRWNLQRGVITIPKSVKESRIIDNAKVFDFELSVEEIEMINGLDRMERIGPDPSNFNF
ncbi:aldo/keto reductase family oxidoreductase [Formosa agariphila KMM 3901]|uniref:Aldo/keto reductase family oxidoreductase n=1 Tax=Formosa agariphila (strain DSM 15362 / KCTC 12365 / LMG 23005 / KMM 3901 / M-2Alg 35-1) TaxID=1347342 RepID=T2KRW2_FORAG|nr:aldo/keto reductase [Formosa agariphila]CDF80784.1 aldo/keto reductase family oxidoreductase [Formosa agariphila KMM 3901]